MGHLARILAIALSLGASIAQAHELHAKLDATRSSVTDAGEQIAVQLHLSHPVPFRVLHLQSPPRLAVDFTGADLSGIVPSRFITSARVEDSAAGRMTHETSRLVLKFDAPFVLDNSRVEKLGQAARLNLWLRSSTEEELSQIARANAQLVAGRSETSLPPSEVTRQDGSRPLRVMLDPGHGGIDPGALNEGHVEADLVLEFAFELKDDLEAAGMEVFLTRDADVFVSLERRVALAQQARADLLLSLHADALEEGDASGASVYTISDRASDKLSKLLVQRHNRAEILAGVDLTAQDDQIADVLTDLARQNTLPRADALADALVAALSETIGHMHKQPRLEAGFSVLKSAEVPSVMLELGFLSNAEDRARLVNPEWRALARRGIRMALENWAKADAAEARKLRR